MTIPTALDVDPSAFNAHEQKIVANVREHGWFCTSVFAEEDQPGFSYSTGFWVSAQMAEVIVFGLGKTAHSVLWDMFRDGKSGIKHPVSVRTDQIFAGFPAYLFPVSKKYYREYPLSSRWFYGDEKFPCLQLVWPDPKGVFPWEHGFDEKFRADQPDLTEHGWLNSLAN